MRARARIGNSLAGVMVAVLVTGCGTPEVPSQPPSPTPAVATASPTGTPRAATPTPRSSASPAPTASVEPAAVSDGGATRVWLGPLPDSPFPGGEAQPTRVEDIAWTGAGWVAVGWDERGAIAWRSTDGVTWTSTDRQPSLDLSRMHAVAASGGLVVAGGSDGSGRAAAWWSDDGGATWTRSADTPDMRTYGHIPVPGHGYYGVTIQSIAALATGGFIAVGSLSCDCQAGGFAAWQSDDGRSWHRLRSAVVPEPGNGTVVVALGNGWLAGGGAIRRAAAAGWSTTQGTASALAAGHGLVVRARVRTQPGDPPAAVYWSRNGTHWTRGQLSADDPWIVDMTATPDGFAAVGIQRQQPPGRLWTTTDGRDWTASEVPLLAGEPTAVAASADRLAITMNLGPAGGDVRPAVVLVPEVQALSPVVAAPSRPPWTAPSVLAATGLQHVGVVERAAAALRADGTILIAGGVRDTEGGSQTGSRTTLVVDPAAGTVRDGPPLPIRVAGAAAATAPDGRTWVLGSTGHSKGATGWVLNEAGTSWTAAPSSLRNLPALAAAWESDATLLVTDGGQGDQVLTTYDAVARTHRRALIPFAGPGVAVAASPDATYLVTQTRVWSRQTGTDTWVPGPSLPYPSGSTSTTIHAAVLADGRLAVEVDDVLGPTCTTDDVFSMIEVLDPTSGAWASGALPQPRVGESLVALPDGRLAVIGGFRRTLDQCEWSGEQDLTDQLLLVTPPG